MATCLKCGTSFHACSSCCLNNDWEYQYCSEKCMRSSSEYLACKEIFEKIGVQAVEIILDYSEYFRDIISVLNRELE